MARYKAVNKDFFKTWTTEMAYTLGFIFADGNISISKKGGKYLAFHSSDESLLEEIKNAMLSDHKIAKRNIRSGNVYRLQIGSRIIVDDLARLQLNQTKTKRMNFPNMPWEYMPAFVLGFLMEMEMFGQGKYTKKG